MDYCQFVSVAEDRQECAVAVSYIEAVLDHDCVDDESEYCAYYNESGEFTSYFSTLPPQIREDVYETFTGAFGFNRDDVPAAFDAIVLGNGLLPHPIFSSEPEVAHLPASWNLDRYDFRSDADRAVDEPFSRPAGWATPFDFSIDPLSFRDPDGSATEIDARVATRLSAAYYFDPGLFVTGGFKFTAMFADKAGVFNFDLSIEGGYYLSVLDDFGIEFFGRLDLGYLMSDGEVENERGRPETLSSFDAAVGGGIRAMIRLRDEPIKSNMPHLSIGATYLRDLNFDLLAPDMLFISTGFLFNYV